MNVHKILNVIALKIELIRWLRRVFGYYAQSGAREVANCDATEGNG
jgi:hypothetical protein